MLDDLSVISYDDDTRIRTQDGDLRVTVYDDDVQVKVDAAIAINGQDGAGVTPGGLEGWLLAKISGIDFDTTWVPPQVPLGGTADQVLTKTGPDPFASEWRNAPPGVPTGGNGGEVLAKLSNSPFDVIWTALPNPDLRVAKAGDIMTGALQLSGDPLDPLHATTKQYTDTKAPIESPALAGEPTAPTPILSDNSNRIATSAFVQNEFDLQLPFYLNKTGGTMSGPITLPGNPASALQAAPKQYVDAAPGSSGPYQLEVDTISRSNQERWNDHLNIAEIAPVDVDGGAPGTAHTAILGAWNKALSRNRRSVIHLPAGILRLGVVLELLNEYALATDYIEIVGEGMYATTLIGPASCHDVIRLGSNGVALGTVPQSGNITFRDLAISPGAVHTGALIGIRNCSNCRFINVRFNLGKEGVTFEEDADAIVGFKKCSNHFLTNCEGSCQNGGIIVHPRTVESLHIQGGKWGGGVGRRFFVHDWPSSGCDGVYLTGGYFEQFDSAFEALGGSMVNVQIQAKQFDRSPCFIKAQPPAGVPGLYRNWLVKDTQFNGGDITDDAIIWDASLGTAGAICEGLNITGCNFHRIAGRILYVGEGNGVMSGIIARTCGNSGTELIRIGAAGNFEMVGIQGYRGALDTTAGFPTHGIIYDGPSTGKRGHTACRFWDATVAPFSGTP